MNRHKLITLLCVFLCASSAYSQQDNIWYFGKWAGLNFSTGNAEAITNSPLSTIEGSTVMCDVGGNLLFYSNGATVWNRNHQFMPNGTGLAGHHSSSQSCIAILKPGSTTHYYLFVTDAEARAGGLTYSEIDMAANNGLGAVVNKNVQLVTPTAEKLCAAYHANGTDIWITTKHWGSNAFYSYLITAAGVNPVPVVSNAGIVTEGATNSGKYAGYMAISPDGSKLAIANSQVNVQLLDFNNSTGSVGNAVTLSTGGHAYGVEFSPSSNLLYVTREAKLYQYRVNAPDVASTEALITNMSSDCAIRLGPDGKIYVDMGYLQNTLSVINNPDEPGAGCNFVQGQAGLAGRQTFSGLPSFLATPLYLTGVVAAGNCAGNAISFTFSSTMAPDTVEWDFGDGGTSTAFSPTHTYAAAGTYTVSTKASKGNMVRYFNRTVTIMPGTHAVQPQDMVQCDDDADGHAIFNLRLQDAQILGAQSPAVNFVSYHATQADAEAGINNLPDDYINTQNPQMIYARVFSGPGTACYAITSFKLIVTQKPMLHMDDLYTFCGGNTTPVQAPPGFDGYLWSNGETTQAIQAGPGQYTVTVIKSYGSVTCSATAAFTVVKSGAPLIRNIETYDWTDHTNSIYVKAEGGGAFEYSINGIDYQLSPVFNNLEPGVYTVHVRDSNGCGHVDEEVALLMYPRYFTPNGDGVHETWRIKFGQYEPELQVYIFDRYGKLLTSFGGESAGWDGRYNGRDLPSTDYWFVAVRKNGRQYKGHFSMLR